ncbi:MAG: hypothetical protein BXU00_01325 [Candidatus Nanoclepta minutus]|uniref:Uncharacterized protein n=1 Tax=Candidatus Nanoclepta minutus TaxID=1940235 RepID=A0A397WPG0_9ARCH|nr:MAG: hypothetical protein BXU00_01325 [Candidatus Nanoclepta minutus]
MVVKNPLSKIRESFEIHQLEKKIEDVYRKYGEITLKFVRGYIEALKKGKEISNDGYRRVLETLLCEDIIEFMNYTWEKYYKEVNMIPTQIIYGISNFAKYVRDTDMLKDFIRVLKIYGDVSHPIFKIPSSELISSRMFYPPYYGTLLKEDDPRITSAVKCTLDELLKEETKQRVREDEYVIDKIIVNCAEKAGFRPDYIKIKALE